MPAHRYTCLVQGCEIGGRFSRCVNPAVQSCQYCGRRFCRDHSYFLEGHEAVCSRKHCRAKRDDMVLHSAYRRVVETRNRAGLCGIEDCGPHPAHECSLCHGHFCSAHVSQQSYPFFDGYARAERFVSVCPRCWERRKIWGRVR